MINKINFVQTSFLCLMFLSLMFFGNHVLAAEQTINGNLIVNGGVAVRGDFYADHNLIKFNPAGYPGIDPTITFLRGDSQIKEMGDLYVISDDYIHLAHSWNDYGRVLIQNISEIQHQSRTGHGNLEAGNIYVNDLLTFSEGATADFTNAEVIGFGPLESMSEEIDEKVSIYGDTMLGVLNADSGLDINRGNFTINPDGSSYIGGNMTLNGNATLTVSNVSYLNGGISIPSGGFVVNPEGGIYTSGIVDFSGAASFGLPTQPTAERGVCDSGSKGKMYFDTDASSFWGCNGTNWLEFSTEPLN